MIGTVFFWTALCVFGFVFFLALQARTIAGVVIARALRARDKALPVKDSRLAVVKAANGEVGIPEVDYILETWPVQIRQLKIARRLSVIAPVFILAVLAYGRMTGRI